MITAAVYQGPLKSVEENLKSCSWACSQAAYHNSDIIVFPEVFYCGYGLEPNALKKHSITADDLVKILSPIAKRNQLNIAMPYAEKDGNSIYNSVVIVDWKGNYLFNYRKCNLWGKYEHDNFTPGDKLETFELTTRNNVKVTAGCIICFDVEFPEPARCLALQGAKLLIVPTALAVGPASEVTPNRIVPARASENLMFLLYSNFIGSGIDETASTVFCGRSGIFAPDGSELARGDAHCELVLVRKIDLSGFKDYEIRNPYLSVVKRKWADGLYQSYNKSKL